MVKFFPRGVLLALLVAALLGVSQNGYALKKVKTSTAKNDPTVTNVVSGSAVKGIDNAATVTSVKIDTIPNALSMWGGAQQPVAYDPASNSPVVIYRHNFGGGSGQIAYKASTDGGATWGATQGPLNGTLGANGRYPNITLSNPTNGTDPGGVSPVFVYPFLVNGAFGGAVYGNDAYINAGATTVSNLDTSDTWSTYFYPMASNTGAGVVVISALSATIGDIQLLKSTDNGGSWASTWAHPAGLTGNAMYDSTGGIWNLKGWDYIGGKWYLCAQGYNPKGTNDTTKFYDFIVYSSTDGTTWTSEVVRPSTISGLTGYINYTGGAFSAGIHAVDQQEIDFAVDKNGTPHIFATFTSDTTGGVAKAASVFELTKVAGAWTATKIVTLHGVVNFAGNAQRFTEVGAARDSAGTVLAVKWVDYAAANDTIPDIFTSARKITGTWTTPTNQTNTSQASGPYYLWTNIANRIGTDGSLFITWVKQKSGIPDGGGTGSAPYTVWILQGVKATTGVAAQKDASAPLSYTLHQNYPNPFNPTTNIVYELPKSSFVTLKVYNVIGQEVSTLVNTMQEAGSHSVTFDASRLASGVYFYRLSTAGFTQTYKMILQK